jgi:hypothetical protein
MKKLLFIATFLITLSSFSQTTPDAAPSNWGKYASFSASISSQEGVSTLESSYYTIEAGVCYKNISGGLGFGKNFQGDPSANNWFVEPRFVWNILDLTAFKAGIIGGFGTYLAPDKPLITEIGVGTEVDTDYINYTLQFTNWGTASSNANYVSIGICKSF